MTLNHDLSREETLRVLRDFGDAAENADWAAIYFAGHGIEVGGTNYLVPVDARRRSDRHIEFEAVELEQVIHATERARKLRLVLVDACRNDPFLASLRRTGASRAVSHGLARIEPDGGTPRSTTPPRPAAPSRA